MTPVTTFNKWILSKINGYLAYKEGCFIEHMEYTQEGARSVVKDVFGIEYEISIRTLGRVSGQVNRLPEDKPLLERVK